MQEALLEMPSGLCPPFEAGALGALFEPSSTRETKLISSEVSLIGTLLSQLDRQLLEGLGSRTAKEFMLVRNKMLPRYVRALRALSDTMSNLVSPAEIEQRSKEALVAISSDLEKQRGARFTDQLVEQALFTMWTLGKNRELGRQICAEAEPIDKKADAALALDYQVHSRWAQFHLDSVVAAMKFRKDVPSEIQEALCDGMRAMVNAHVIIKEALSLRRSQAEAPAIANLPWDEEDERLLASSMRAINVIADASDC